MAPVVSEIQVSKLVTHSTSPVRNCQPAGIGRLAAIYGVLVINNLGRNIEVSAADRQGLTPLHIFQETAFPDEDEPSQFDLDIHGFLSGCDRRQLISINHYGLVRLLAPTGRSGFADRSAGASLELLSEINLKWPGDAERFVLAGSCMLSSSPRGYAVDDAAETGILISESWDRAIAGDSGSRERVGAIDAQRMRYRTELADWGMITALAVSDCGRMLALAAGTRLGVFRVSYDAGGDVELEQLLWQRPVACTVVWLHFSPDGGDLLAGGCSPSAQDDNGADWETLRGGSLGAFDCNTGEDRWLTNLEIDLAWGNGGDPLVYVPEKMLIAGVDRRGCLTLWNLADGRSSPATRPQSHESMGIAHMTCLGNSVYCGFNRGGYSIFRYQL